MTQSYMCTYDFYMRMNPFNSRCIPFFYVRSTLQKDLSLSSDDSEGDEENDDNDDSEAESNSVSDYNNAFNPEYRVTGSRLSGRNLGGIAINKLNVSE